MKNIDLSNRVEDTESVARELIPLNTKISYKNQPNHNDNKKLRDQDAGDFLRKH
jgi:hypothetical protein